MIDAAQTQEPCRVCGTKEFASTCERSDLVGDATTWGRCAHCGVERIVPYPTQEELASYYDDAYVTKCCTGSVSHALRYSPTYADRVHDEYRISLKDVGIEPDELRTLRILDVGCAEGIFLDLLREQGVPAGQAIGVDISPEMVEVAQASGHEVLTMNELETLQSQSFDLVTLWDVFEHLLDPHEMLALIKPLLADSGQILIQTPRMGRLSEAYGPTFEHYLPFEHVHLYRRETLVWLFEKHGFSVEAAASFGGNVPVERVPQPYKRAFDQLAKATDEGATQLMLFRLRDRVPPRN